MGTWHNSSSNSLVNGRYFFLSLLNSIYILLCFVLLERWFKRSCYVVTYFFPSLFNKQPFITIIPITSDMNSVYWIITNRCVFSFLNRWHSERQWNLFRTGILCSFTSGGLNPFTNLGKWSRSWQLLITRVPRRCPWRHTADQSYTSRCTVSSFDSRLLWWTV